MVQGIPTSTKQTLDSLIQECAVTLKCVADYKLPVAVDRRLLWLSENKEALTPSECDELLALIDFSEDRTVEKLRAKLVLLELHPPIDDMV